MTKTITTYLSLISACKIRIVPSLFTIASFVVTARFEYVKFVPLNMDSPKFKFRTNVFFSVVIINLSHLGDQAADSPKQY